MGVECAYGEDTWVYGDMDHIRDMAARGYARMDSRYSIYNLRFSIYDSKFNAAKSPKCCFAAWFCLRQGFRLRLRYAGQVGGQAPALYLERDLSRQIRQNISSQPHHKLWRHREGL